jgi:hypothetical protein
MNFTDDTTTINSIEELTLHTLGRSLEGLELLRRESIGCGEELLKNNQKGLEKFREFTKNLRDFCVFENDVCSFFMIDRTQIRDVKGDLEAVENKMNEIMGALSENLSNSDLNTLADLLRIDLPYVLDRFQDLLPALSSYIENEYVINITT